MILRVCKIIRRVETILEYFIHIVFESWILEYLFDITIPIITYPTQIPELFVNFTMKGQHDEKDKKVQDHKKGWLTQRVKLQNQIFIQQDYTALMHDIFKI